LFYTLQKPTTPVWAKTVIIVALGYFIFPIDLIPDLVPGGYTDDFSGLFGALITVSMFIDEEVNNLQQALIGTSSDDLKEIESATESLEKEILKQDDFIQINELSASAIGRHSPPPSGFEKALKLVFGAVVGMTVATLIVQDLYKLGAYSACHKWGKKKPKVKKACKALGYW
jgi:uncharacterized membrane protein YkvA (DUF1232 family)